jgi:hypothetical protein
MDANHDLGIRYDECDISIDHWDDEIYIRRFDCHPLIDLQDVYWSELSASERNVVAGYLDEIGVQYDEGDDYEF